MIFDIRGFSVHDGPGIRTTAFLKGCPLRCAWCHNPESQEASVENIVSIRNIGNQQFTVKEKVGKLMSVKQVMEIFIRDVLFFEESSGGVTVSGGEPLMQPGFTSALLQECQKHDIHTALDTCGHANPEALEQVLPYTNLFLYDLKLASDEDHKKYTGESNRLVLKNLKTVSRSGKSMIIRIPLVQGITDTPKNLGDLKNIIESTAGILRIDLLPYHPAGLGKYKRTGKTSTFEGQSAYNPEKAIEIQEFFKNSATQVSIGA